MRLSKKYGGLQFFGAPNPSYFISIVVNGINKQLVADSGIWEKDADNNANLYTCVNNQVIWKSNSGILQYNGTTVHPTDQIIHGGSYTTIDGGEVHQ